MEILDRIKNVGIMKLFELLAWIAVIVTTGLAYSSFQQQTETLNLERLALQVNVYNELTSRMYRAYKDRPDNPLYNSSWYEEILNRLEEFAFYANREYLQPDMIKFQEAFVVSTIEDIVPKYSKVIFGRTIKEEELGELRIFYNKATGGKDLQSLIPKTSGNKK